MFVPGPTGAAGSPSAVEVVGADVPTSSFAVNSLAYVDIVNDTANIAVGDTIELEAEFAILNNSAATRVYTVELTFGAQVIEAPMTSLVNNATNWGRIRCKGVFGVDSAALWRLLMVTEYFGTAAKNTPANFIGTSADGQSNYNTGVTDETGAGKAVKLRVKSASATATQTLELVSYRIRKVPTT